MKLFGKGVNDIELKKRDCPIRIGLTPVGAGWIDMTLEVADDRYEISISGCLGSGIGGFIGCIYQLYRGKDSNPDKGMIEDIYEFVDVKKNGQVVGRRARAASDKAWYEVPKTTVCDLSEEGHGYVFRFEREAVNTTDFNVEMMVEEYGCVYEGQERIFTYNMRYSDLCYAMGKALTEAVKSVGFGGFCEDAWDTDVSIRHLCFLKAVGLGHPEWVMPTCENAKAPAKTSFAVEMELVDFDL